MFENFDGYLRYLRISIADVCCSRLRKTFIKCPSQTGSAYICGKNCQQPMKILKYLSKFSNTRQSQTNVSCKRVPYTSGVEILTYIKHLSNFSNRRHSQTNVKNTHRVSQIWDIRKRISFANGSSNSFFDSRCVLHCVALCCGMLLSLSLYFSTPNVSTHSLSIFANIGHQNLWFSFVYQEPN